VPPYSLAPIVFPFPALAACAARAQLGGDRELALGALAAARLAVATSLGHALPAPERSIRADRARHWLSTLAMPQQARLAFFRAFDASTGSPIAAGEALAELGRMLVGHLDDPAHDELRRCAERLRLYFEQTP